MLGGASSADAAADVSVVQRMQPAAEMLPWLAAMAAALLSLALGLALSGVLAAERSSRAAERASVAAAGGHRRAAQQRGLSSLPLGAQGPISAALGADDPAYRVRSSGGNFKASSPAQRLRESFGRGGVRVSSGEKTYVPFRHTYSSRTAGELANAVFQ